MTLTPGTRIGPYEVTVPIGEGGMGEVYKARDTRLDRIVAIKILPEALAGDPQFRERFDREAKAIAALTHPHICTLYDVGHHEGTRFLVMEYLDGESLEVRLRKGALPLDQALTIANQIAGAIDKAHRAGIVHRDLKPGNIMLTESGAKLLDFGLAKTIGPAVALNAVSVLPTMPPAAMTVQGTILGTFQYMAPEQLEGQDADARTDIFAFGAVLYEILTGRKPFEGKSHASVMAAILERPLASASSVQPLVPRNLDSIIATCLARNPDDRWQSMGDVSRLLKWAREGNISVDREPPPGTGASALSRRLLVPVLATAIVSVALGGVGGWMLRPSAPVTRATVSRLVLTPGDSTALVNVTGFDVVISPDGTQVVYLGERPQGGRALYLRGIAGLDPRMIPGTELPSDFTNANPFFSWDGAWIAYRSPGQGLVKVPVTGGSPTKIADLGDTATFLGGSWGGDEKLVVSLLRGGSANGLYTVSTAGGFERLTPGAREDIIYLAPTILPNGRAVLFQAIDVRAGTERVEVLDLQSRVERTLIDGGANPAYLSSGHLVFARGTTLMAVGFDINSLEIRGTPVAVVENVRHPGLVTAADYSLSRGGDLIYVPNMSQASGKVAPVWVDRTGSRAASAVSGPLDNPRDLRLSPDGSRLALITGPANDGDLWVYNLAGRPPVPLIDKGDVRGPLWSMDASRVFFTSNQGGGAYEVYSLPADGGSLKPELVPTSSESLAGDLTWRAPRSPLTWLPDGRLAFTRVRTTGGGADILAIAPGSGKAEDVVKTEFDEDSAQISPDGRWLAYRSTRTGRSEIWVKGAADSAPVRVSENGGQEPVWSRSGRELYYVEGNKVMLAAVTPGPTFAFQPVASLFDVPFFHVPASLTVSGWAGGRSYDVGPDGRFLMIPLAGDRDLQTAHTNIVVVQNWQEELKRLVPAKYN